MSSAVNCICTVPVGPWAEVINSALLPSPQHTLRQQGVPCLSIHDSFIVPQSAGALTEAAMNEEFQCACQQLRAKR